MNARTLTVFVPVLCVATGYALWSYDHSWVGEWNWTFDTLTGTTVITGPIMAAMASWMAMRARSLDPVTSTNVRAWAIPWRIALELWAAGVGVYLLGVGSASVATAISVNGGPHSAWVLFMGPLVLGFSVAVGVLTGTLWPFRITALMTGCGMFLFGVFGPAELANLIRPGPTTGSLAGLKFDGVVWTAQAAVLCGLILICGAVVAKRARRHGAALNYLLVAGVAIAATGFGVIVKHGDERLIPSDEVASACAGARPRVCLAPSNRVLLERVSDGLSKGGQQMRQRGLEPAADFAQVLPSEPPQADVGLIVRLPSTDEERDESWVWTALLTPAGCQFWLDPRVAPPEKVYEAQALLEAWIIEGESAGETAWSEDSRRWLRDSESKDAMKWANRTYDALKSCDVDAIKLPYGQSRS